MNKDNLIFRIRKIIAPIIHEEGFELVDLQFSKGGKNFFLRIFIDKKDGGVTLDDCQNISTQVGAILDVEDLIDRRYILEVSSPGLDRPLKKNEDYIRYKGRIVKLNTINSYNNKKNFIGKIIDFKNDILTLKIKNDGIINIPYNQISNARLEIEF
ncbi:MAG TPA: ribosome maturation factor RimP [Nitrospinota bacterium]|nr:ribosome maturation factor RimP [Nitrospinota bacterium]